MRFPSLLTICVLLLPSVAQAQLFPRLFPRLQPNKVSSACPGGVCPTGFSSSVPTYATTANTGGGHWSYPGTITNHLESTHGVSTAGLTRQQQLNLHDSLHEGGSAPAQSNRLAVTRRSDNTAYYQPVSSVSSYGSTGSQAQGYGSTGSTYQSQIQTLNFGYGSSGSLTVGQSDSQGHIVTAIFPPQPVRVQASQVCNCGFTALKLDQEVVAEIQNAYQLSGPTLMEKSVSASDEVSNTEFRRALWKAARQARQSNQISVGQHFQIIVGSLSPSSLSAARQAVEEGVSADGTVVYGATGAFDWAKMFELLLKYLPMILDLFKK